MNELFSWEFCSRVCTALLFVLGILIGLLPSTGKIYDNRKAFFRAFTPRGWWVLLLVVISVLVYALQEHSNQQLKRLADERDSLFREKTQKHADSSLTDHQKEVTKIFVDALARNNLRLDSVSGDIKNSIVMDVKQAINDSLRNVPMPEIGLCSRKEVVLDSVSAGTCYFSLNFCITNASAIDVTIQMAHAYGTNGQPFRFHFIGKEGVPEYLMKHRRLSLNKAQTAYVQLPLRNYESVFWLFKIVWKDTKNKQYMSNDIFQFDFKDRTSGIASYLTDSMARKGFNRAGVY
jgi:hypothetical protein